jgi:predicted ATPase
MAISLKELVPTKISRDLRGKFILVYGSPKTGKTTLLSQLPNSLILAFEPGTNALNNAYVQPINKWTDFKTVLRQLRDEEVQQKFHFIGIDTADIA